ncbi:MAG: methyltransferase domain-containing protein [Planctomycetota bacterium]
MAPSLATRVLTPELMDDPAIDPGDHDRALRGLARLNRLALAANGVWRSLAPLLRDLDRPARVLDVASGSGDVAIGVSRIAARLGHPLELSACDISPLACDRIRTRAGANGLDVRVFQADIIGDQIENRYDVVMCSLFMHHLSAPDAKALITNMSCAAGRAALVCDLLRTKLGYALAFLASRTATRSHVVHTDALLSVRAAFTLAEARSVGESAGLTEIMARRVWPERFAIAWKGTG